MTNANIAPPQLVTLGETLAALSSPNPRPMRHARSLDLSIGGAESNTAIAAARLGVRTSWTGRVGDDELGRLIVRELRAENLDVRGIVDPVHPTAVMLKSHRTSDLMNVVYYRTGSAGSFLNAEDIDADIIRSAAVLHVSAITPALSESAREATHFAISSARAAGVLVSIDLNYRSALWSVADAAPEFRSLISLADVLFATSTEAKIAVDGNSPEELAAQLRALGAQHVILKMGSKGGLYTHGTVSLPIVPFAVHAVDDVGAGDAFAAGYLSSLILGGDVAQNVKWAAALGALAVSTSGDWEGSPTMAELEAFLKSSPDSDSVVR